MSNSERPNEPMDHFSEYVRQRLINNPSPPDESCWDEIETRMDKKRPLSPMWPVAIAASILVAVFILNNTVIEKKRHTYDPVTESKEMPVKIILPEKNATPEKEIPNSFSGHSHKDIIAKETIKKIPVILPVREETDDIKENNETAEVEKPKKNAEQTEDLTAASMEDREENTTERQKDRLSVSGDTDRQSSQNLRDLTDYNSSPNDRSLKNRRWQISASMGYGGEMGSFLNYPYLSDMMASPDGNNGIGDYNNNEDVIVDMTHSIPISAGITVRKKLNKTLGIETGLIYTYLSTDMEARGSRRYDATLNLHYLGIPVNLIVNLWDNRRWNIYFSGGGMAEKGLQSVYKDDIHGKEKNSISGLQWSLNGGIGVSCNLYKEMNLYVEPGVSYYFDNRQPASKRTEDPFNFNLRLGLRYDL
ncbi:MAG: outer membrane beta-barrel protein [Tannerella sp.]|jgi:hypothetical protein|nr:outer membrane beta-barrel protein [Tannerella sp.]